jgi:hypothetical protein
VHTTKLGKANALLQLAHSPGRIAMSELALGIAENQQNVPVSVGDSITITLHQNAASSGFEWGIVRFSEDLLAFEGRDLEAASGNGMGSGQQAVVFRFGVQSAGSGSVELGLSRGNPKVSSSFNYRVDLNISN